LRVGSGWPVVEELALEAENNSVRFPCLRKCIDEMMTDDMELLRQYARHNSEDAFAALVSRHVNLVYSVALRRVRDAHLAEEITQAVFIILARKTDSLGDKTILSGWLCRTARYASANALTIQRRRQQREHDSYMQSLWKESESDAWMQIAPLLDTALAQLGQKDHDALVLRFFEGKNLKQVGAALGTGEDTARMRINRAVGKLRTFFVKRGITLSAGMIAGAISANSVQAAPATLAKSITTVAITKGVAASGSTLTLINGALKLMAWTKTQTAAVAVAAIIVASGTTTLVIQHQHQPRPQLAQAIAPAEADFPRTSWSFAGYANPQSALLSTIWSLSAGDLEKFLASFTPSERERQLQQLKIGAQKAGKSVADFFTSIGTQGNMPDTTGFRVLDQQIISDDQVILRVSIQRTVPGKEQQVLEGKIIKIGNEWKVDKFDPK
jgi:RNA polymerase sigma factor (sigma-70 family)